MPSRLIYYLALVYASPCTPASFWAYAPPPQQETKALARNEIIEEKNLKRELGKKPEKSALAEMSPIVQAHGHNILARVPDQNRPQ